MEAQVAGIEVADTLLFDTWTVGAELTKNVTLKNVRYKAVKVSCSLHTDHFSVMQPVQGQLVSPGTFLHIPVTFHPDAQTDYSACLEIDVHGEKVAVTLCARAPRATLTCPSTVNVGDHAINTLASTSFTISNPTSFITTWKVEDLANFSVDPLFGVLDPKASATVTVSFNPTEARRYVSSASIFFDADMGDGDYGDNMGTGSVPVAFVGTGKFPYLSFEDGSKEHTLDFGQANAHAVSTEQFSITNHSSVQAQYDVTHSYLGSPCFKLAGNTGVIAPHSQATFEIEYTAGPLHHHANEFFKFTSSTGAVLRVTCKGDTTSAQVLCETSSITFGAISVGEAQAENIVLRNASTLTVPFSALFDDVGPFHIHSPDAVSAIPPLGQVELTVEFTPSHPVHYAATLQISIENHAPISIRLAGRGIKDGSADDTTCFDADGDVLAEAELRLHSGFGGLSPLQFDAMVRSGAVEFDSDAGIWIKAPPKEKVAEQQSPQQQQPDRSGSVMPPSMLEKRTSGAPLSVNFPPGSRRVSMPRRASLRPTQGSARKTPTLEHEDNSPTPSMPVAPRNEASQPVTAAPIASTTPVPDASNIVLVHDPRSLVTLSNHIVDFGWCPAGSKKLVSKIEKKRVAVCNKTEDTLFVAWPSMVRRGPHVAPDVAATTTTTAPTAASTTVASLASTAITKNISPRQALANATSSLRATRRGNVEDLPTPFSNLPIPFYIEPAQCTIGPHETAVFTISVAPAREGEVLDAVVALYANFSCSASTADPAAANMPWSIPLSLSANTLPENRPPAPKESDNVAEAEKGGAKKQQEHRGKGSLPIKQKPPRTAKEQEAKTPAKKDGGSTKKKSGSDDSDGNIDGGDPQGLAPLGSDADLSYGELSVTNAPESLPATSPLVASFSTLWLTNHGRLPMPVSITGSSEDHFAFSATPFVVLRGGESRLITLGATPHKAGHHHPIISISAPTTNRTLELSCHAFHPALAPTKPKATFGRVCLGQSLTTEFTLHNPEGISVFYAMTIPAAKQENELSLIGTGGVVEPNEEVTHSILVHATSQGAFSDTVAIRYGTAPDELPFSTSVQVAGIVELPSIRALVRNQPSGPDANSSSSNNNNNNSGSGSGSDLQHQKAASKKASVDGTATTQLLAGTKYGVKKQNVGASQQAIVNLGPMYVATVKEVDVELMNTGHVPAIFTLEHDLGDCLEISDSNISLPPRCRHLISLRLKPKHEGEDMFTIRAGIAAEDGVFLSSQSILTCAYEGVRSKLIFSDIRSQDLSVIELWETWNLSGINTALSPLPNQVAEETSFPLHFGCSSHLANETVVYAQLTNNSKADCEWRAFMPQDLRWSEEAWAVDPENGGVSAGDTSDDFLFDFQPRRGELRVGESATITLRYKHDQIGTHEVPVLFKQNLSETVLQLHLVGQTLAAGMPHLITSTEHELKNVTIGVQHPPHQHLLLRNPSDVDVHFSFDSAALKSFAEDNFDFPVLSCETMSGVIPPGGFVSTLWTFQPLEARRYIFPVPLHVEDFEQSPIMVTFSGKGVDPRVQARMREAALAQADSIDEETSPSSSPILAGDARPLTRIDTAGSQRGRGLASSPLASGTQTPRSPKSSRHASHRHAQPHARASRHQGATTPSGQHQRPPSSKRQRRSSARPGVDTSGDGRLSPRGQAMSEDGRLRGPRTGDPRAQRTDASGPVVDENIPTHQHFLLPGQLAVLSCDVVDFGNVPQHSISRYMLYVRNTCDTVVRYAFELEALENVVSIEPSTGSVGPGEQQVCKLVFTAREGAGQYDTRIKCILSDLSGMQAHAAIVQQNEASEREAKHLFTYSDRHRIGKGRSGGLRPGFDAVSDGSSPDDAPGLVMDSSLFPQKVLNAGVAPSLSNTLSKSFMTKGEKALGNATSKLRPVKGKHAVHATDTDLRSSRYQALPPIREKTAMRLRTPPEPQQSFFCYLTVRCVVQHEMDFDDDTSRNMFVDRTMGALNTTRADDDQMAELSEDVVAARDILQLMLREAVSDTKFTDALEKLQKEAFPVFNSIRAGVEAEGYDAHTAALPSELGFAEGMLDGVMTAILGELEETVFRDFPAATLDSTAA